MRCVEGGEDTIDVKYHLWNSFLLPLLNTSLILSHIGSDLQFSTTNVSFTSVIFYYYCCL